MLEMEEGVMAKRPRGTGSLYKQKDSAVWWMQFVLDGKRHRETTGETDKALAEVRLQERLAVVRTSGPPTPVSLTVGSLVEDKLAHDRIQGLKDTDSNEGRYRLHIKPALGNVKARDLTTAMLTNYIAKRQGEGAPNSTVNREMALVRGSFSLARKAGTLRQVPWFPMLGEDNARKGFLPDDKYASLAAACVEEGLWLAAAFEVAYAYGWRRGEIFSLTVGQADFLDNSIRLYDSKNGEGRLVFMTARVKALLLECCKGKQPSDLIITRNGRPVVDTREAWERATTAAGVPGLILHDLRRTGVRNLRRLGVSEHVAMRISGHKTSSVFRRYDIVDEDDLREVAKRLDTAQAYRSVIESGTMAHERVQVPEIKWAQQDSNLRPTDYESNLSSGDIVVHPLGNVAKE
jgi:integrase